MPIVSDKAVREIEEQIQTEAQGQGTEPEGTGGTNRCVCPSCGYETAHARGTPCNQTTCPKCGATMTGGPEAVGSKVKQRKQTESRSLSGSEKNYLEKLIDGSSPQAVVDTLVDICGEKADHVRTNWQDEPLAKVWEKAGKILDTARAKLPKIP